MSKEPKHSDRRVAYLIDNKDEPVSNSDKLEHVKDPNKLPEQLSSKMEHTAPSLNNWEQFDIDFDKAYNNYAAAPIKRYSRVKELCKSQITLAIQKERERCLKIVKENTGKALREAIKGVEEK